MSLSDQFPDNAGANLMGGVVGAGVGGTNAPVEAPAAPAAVDDPAPKANNPYEGLPTTVYAYKGYGSHDEGWGLGV